MLPQIAARLRPPRMGVIRLGVKELTRTRGGKDVELPKEVPYFVLPEPLATAIAASTGEKRPTRLHVMLPVDDPDKVLRASFTRYDGALCTLQCNGETYWRWPKDGARVEGVCCRREEGSVEWPEGPGSCGAEAVARFSVIPLDGPLGVYQIPIGGEQRIADLYGDLLTYSRVFGRLTGIVFECVRVPQEVQIQTQEGKRMPRTGWPVRLFCAAATRQALESSGRDLRALPGWTAPTEGQKALDALRSELRPDTEVPFDAPDLPADDAPWDISASIAAAVRLGVTSDEYAAYVNGKYKPHTVSDLTVAEEGEQEKILRKALAEPTYAKRFVDHVRTVARGTRL